jgi:hypothetical protein
LVHSFWDLPAAEVPAVEALFMPGILATYNPLKGVQPMT